VNMPSRAWLPDEALRGGTVERVIGEAVLRWSEKWFPRQLVGGLEPPARTDAALVTAEEAPHVCLHPDGLSISASPPARLAIAGMMLDAVIDAARQTAADRYILEALADGCIEDLGRELGRTFRLSAEGGWRRSVGAPSRDAETFAVGSVEGRPLLHVAVDFPLAVELVKSRAPVPPAGRALRPMAEGLARQKVPVSALLGRCRLSLGDFAGLAAGDVLVLDRALEDELELALGGQATGARCTIASEGEALSLNIVDSLNG
jgi:flagellar motor switch/type III secretory pathway protein FliN